MVVQAIVGAFVNKRPVTHSVAKQPHSQLGLHTILAVFLAMGVWSRNTDYTGHVSGHGGVVWEYRPYWPCSRSWGCGLGIQTILAMFPVMGVWSGNTHHTNLVPGHGGVAWKHLLYILSIVSGGLRTCHTCRTAQRVAGFQHLKS